MLAAVRWFSPKTCRPFEPLKETTAAQASLRYAPSLPRAHIEEEKTNMILVMPPTVDSSPKRMSFGRPWSAHLPPCPAASLRDIQYRTGSTCGKRTSPSPGSRPSPARVQRWRHVRSKDPASRPTETVTNPLIPSAHPCNVQSMGWCSDLLGDVTSYLSRENGSHPRRAKLRTPVAAQDDSRRYPPHSLRTFWYVLPELTYCGVVLPRIVCLSPWSQKAGACHRCFIVSLQTILFLVFCPRLCARVPTLSDG